MKNANRYAEISDFNFRGTPLLSFLFREKDGVKVYYKPNKDNINGFDFICIDEFPFIVDDVYSYDMLHCFGIANWEGVKHLYFQDKINSFDLGRSTCSAYFYYPDLKWFSSVLSILQDLEKEFCQAHKQ